jgi:hypothetical protein
MNRLKAVALACLVMISLPGPARAQSGIDGVWDVTLETPQGAMTVEATFKQEGEAVTGSVSSPMGSVDFKGTLVNNALAISYAVPVQDQQLQIEMKGTLAGDTMSGTIAFGSLGEAGWSAKRKAAPAAASAAAAAAAPADASATGGISGKWDVILAMGGGQFPMTATFAQTGEKVTGTLSSQIGEVPITGTMVGNALKFDFTTPTPNGDMAVSMTGELGAEGLKGKANVVGLGEADWTATRAKP